MVDLVNRVEILDLLGKLEEVADKLTSNELEMFAHLKDKYKSPDGGDFDDKLCLEVILRNVSIREGLGMDKNEATRVVDFKSSSSGNGKG